MSMRSAAGATILVAVLSGLLSFHVTFGQTWKRALDSPYGNELKSCRESWASISKQGKKAEIESCLTSLLLSIVPRVKEPTGVPALKIASLDPLVVPEPVQVGGSGVFQGNMTRLTARGVGSGLTPQHMKITYDVARKEATLKVRFPEDFLVTTDYKVVLNAGALFGQNNGGTSTQGKASGTATGVTASLAVAFKDSKNGLRVISSQSTFDAESMKLSFVGDNPSDSLTGFLNTALASPEAGLQLLDEFKPTINRIIALAIGTLFHGGWKSLENI